MLRTFKDLNKVKDNYWENKKEKTLIKVSMSTCGITAGADTIYNYFQEEIDRMGLKDVEVISTGCMGLCHSEPTIEVTLPNIPSEIFGNVDIKKAEKIGTVFLLPLSAYNLLDII